MESEGIREKDGREQNKERAQIWREIRTQTKEAEGIKRREETACRQSPAFRPNRHCEHCSKGKSSVIVPENRISPIVYLHVLVVA